MTSNVPPYVNTLNLSVDNALSSQQIIHQLITKTNELAVTVNAFGDETLKKSKQYTDEQISEVNKNVDIQVMDLKTLIDKINRELIDIYADIEKATDKAIKTSNKYTDDVSDRIYDRIMKVSKDITLAIEECKKYTDTECRLLVNDIKLLDIKLEELAKGTFASVSPLDGETKNNTECFYDLLTVVQRGRCFTLDQFISLATYMLPSNSPNDAYFFPTSLDTLLEWCNDEYWESYVVGCSFGGAQGAPAGLNVSWNANIGEPMTSSVGRVTVPNTLPPRWGNIVSNGMHTLYSFKTKGEIPLNGTEVTSTLAEKLYMCQTGNPSYTNVKTRPSVFDCYTKFKQLGDI